MKEKTKIFMALLLITVVLLSGCAEQKAETTIKSQEEVQEVVSNVTDNIGDIQDTLNDIDKKFG